VTEDYALARWKGIVRLLTAMLTSYENGSFMLQTRSKYLYVKIAVLLPLATLNVRLVKVTISLPVTCPTPLNFSSKKPLLLDSKLSFVLAMSNS
jgi:hypothetical protein